MALPIEPRVYGPLSVPKTPAVRAQARPVPEGDGESVQRAAQAFVQTLPSELRERPTQVNRDPSKKNSFSDAQRAQEDRSSADRVTEDGGDIARPSARGQEGDFSSGAGFNRFTPVANLVQAQLLVQESAGESQTPLSNARYETSHKAYLSAGAQPGGQAEVLKAALLREELANKTVVIPPIQTSFNVVA